MLFRGVGWGGGSGGWGVGGGEWGVGSGECGSRGWGWSAVF